MTVAWVTPTSSTVEMVARGPGSGAFRRSPLAREIVADAACTGAGRSSVLAKEAMPREAVVKLPARNTTHAIPINVAGLPNIPLSCSQLNHFAKTTRPYPVMFLWTAPGKRKKKVGTFVFQPAFLKHRPPGPPRIPLVHWPAPLDGLRARLRSEEHTSELQSRQYLVCRLLLEKKK